MVGEDVAHDEHFDLAGLAKGADRWTFLETIREFAAAQFSLAEEGEKEAIKDRHLAFFRRFAADADEQLLQAAAHELIDEETANLRRALEHAVEHDVDGALDMVASLLSGWG